MAEGFDPYGEWLGIPPGRRPPDHYRLLGVPPFTAEAAAIARAADERMAVLRNHQTGPRGNLTQSLLNEVAAARLCLTNPATKAAYDAQLRQPARPPRAVLVGRVAAPAAPPVAGPPAAPPIHVAPPPVANAPAIPPVVESVDDEPPARAAWVGWAVGIAAVALLAGAAWKASNSHRQTTPPPVAAGNAVEGQSARKRKSFVPAPPDERAVVIQQEADGRLNFRAETATIHGDRAELEVRDAEAAIAHWTASEDWLSWEFRVVKPGFFRAEIEYASDANMAGNTYTVTADDREQRRTVKDSGGREAFVRDTFFVALGRNGQHTLSLRPIRIAGEGLMIFKSLRLTPAAKDRED